MKLLGKELIEIIDLAKEIGCDYLPLGKEFLADALHLLAQGVLVRVDPDPQREGIILVINAI